MQCICCKCGVLNEDARSTLCQTVAEQHYHCFCCAQPPRMKCIHCNMWREVAPMELHSPCIDGSLHVFVYVEPWPPFSDHIPLPPLRAIPVADEAATQMNNPGVSPAATVGNQSIAEHDEYEMDTDNNSAECFIDLAIDEQACQETKPIIEEDIKPKVLRKALWMTIGDIQKWSHCFRCGQVRLMKKGWLHHAQMCAQKSEYTTRKFFIHLHTMAWCGQLVRDVFWDKHSNPENGTCGMCRLSRRNNAPLPYQPKPPPRKNEATLERRRRSRIIKNRKKRRQTISNETLIHNLGGQNSIRIEDCVSLRR